MDTHKATRSLYRGIQGAQPTERDFWSNKRLGRPPRHVEITDDREYDSLSMWDTLEAMEAVCQQFPRVGSHIAQLELPDEPDGGLTLWRSGRPVHWSVQGEPRVLLAQVRRAYAVRQP